MNSMVHVGLLAVLATSLTIQDRQVKPANKAEWLCTPCHWCFDEVEKYLPEFDELTEELLDDAINIVCNRMQVPGIAHVCDMLLDDVIHDLYEYILTLDHFDVTLVCIHLDMCKG
uniref:Saposin B-type domain-containing protein n=1 Tax=Plectus sambesii TaxID=2011161 RepID=A0A914W6W2_9BILA